MMYSLRFQFLRDTKLKSNINLENMQIVSHIITEKQKCKPKHIQPDFELLQCVHRETFNPGASMVQWAKKMPLYLKP